MEHLRKAVEVLESAGFIVWLQPAGVIQAGRRLTVANEIEVLEYGFAIAKCDDKWILEGDGPNGPVRFVGDGPLDLAKMVIQLWSETSMR